MAQPTDLLSRSYFACKVRNSSSAMVDQYLSRQSEHHDYDRRVLPPTHVENCELSVADETQITPRPAVAVVQWHLVLATARRRGVFGAAEARGVTVARRQLQTSLPIALSKVSFLPDLVSPQISKYIQNWAGENSPHLRLPIAKEGKLEFDELL